MKSRQAETVLPRLQETVRRAVVDAGKKVPQSVDGFSGGPDKILVNVLGPNWEVNPQYVNYTPGRDDWEWHSEIFASGTTASITLKRANGERGNVLRVNINLIKSENLSIMPEGWERTIAKKGSAD